MTRHSTLMFFAILWLIGMAWSAWSLFGMPTTGDGLARGMNKIFGFLVGQCGAGFAAIVLLILGRKADTRVDKWLARGPAVLSCLIALGLAAAVYLLRPDPPEPAPTRPTTAPAAIAPAEG